MRTTKHSQTSTQQEKQQDSGYRGDTESMAKYPTERQGDVDDSIRPSTQHRSPSTSGSNPYRVFTRWLSRIRQRDIGTSSSGPLYLPTDHDYERCGSAIRSDDLGQRLTGASKRIRLPLTPETDTDYQRDPLHDHLNYLDSKTRLRERRRRRNWYIIWSSVVTSLLVLVYALDVERSWTAIERQWADVSLRSPTRDLLMYMG